MSTVTESSYKLSESDGQGFLYVYKNRPTNDEDDGVVWDEEKRQMLKLIMFDSNSNSYKIKNNKSVDGVSVMRRQVWRSSATGWMKHEYKLFKRSRQPSTFLTLKGGVL